MLDLETPAAFYPGLDGLPLQSGKVYFGVTGQNPITAPITVYWDAAGTQPASQPIAISNGRASRNGAASRIWVTGDYSRLVLDAKGRQVAYDTSQPTGTAALAAQLAAAGGSSLLGFLQGGVSAVMRSIQSKLRETFSVGDAAPAANGATSDTVKIANVGIDLKAAGGGVLDFPPTPNGYGVGQYVGGVQRGIPLPGGVNFNGRNQTCLLTNNSEYIYVGRQQDRSLSNSNAFGTPGVDAAVVTGDTAATDTTLNTAGQGSVFSAGDRVYVRLGQADYDAGEPAWFYYAKVLSSTADSVTLDRPTGYAMSVAATPTDRQRRVIKLTDLPENQVVENFRFHSDETGNANAEVGIFIRYGRNISVRNVRGYNVGAGVVYSQFGENLLIENVFVEKCVKHGQSSKGRVFNFAECKNVLVNGWGAENFEGTLAFVEGNCENVCLHNGYVVNNYPGRLATDALIFLGGGRDLEVDGLRIEGNPATIIQTSTDTLIERPFLRNVFVGRDFTPAWNTIARWFRVDEVEEHVVMGTWFNFTKKKRMTMAITILASQTNKSFPMPNGVITKVTMMATNLTGFTKLCMQDSAGINIVPNPSNLAFTSMTANVPFEFPKTGAYPYWQLGSAHPFTNPGDQRKLVYSTDATAPGTATLFVEIEYFPAAVPLVAADVASYLALT